MVGAGGKKCRDARGRGFEPRWGAHEKRDKDPTGLRGGLNPRHGSRGWSHPRDRKISGAIKRCGPRLGRGCGAGGIGIATKPNSDCSFIYPVGRRWLAKNVAMPRGVGSNPDVVPTRKGKEILRARAVALTRDMAAEVGPTGVIGQISGATKRCGPRLGRGRGAGGIGFATKPNSEWSFIYPVGRRWWAKNVAMPGGVGSSRDGVPTRKGTKILRACTVALTRDMVAEVGPTGVI